MSASRGFISGYILSHGSSMVGFTTRSQTVDGNRSGKLIGFDVTPDVKKYNKFILLVGNPLLEGIILPDIGLLVNVNEFLRGRFVGISVNRESRLRMQSRTKSLEGKDITIFALERVPYTRNDDVDDNEVVALRNLIGISEWEKPNRRAKNDEMNAKTKSDSVSGTKQKQLKKERPSDNSNTTKPSKALALRSQPSQSLIDAVKKEPDTSDDEVIISKFYAEEEGDLFENPDPSSIIINCISADAKMSKGIAVLFASHFPNDVASLREGVLKVGDVRIYGVSEQGAPSRGYLVTKKAYNHKPTKASVKRCLLKLRNMCISYNITKIAGPKIACGLDGLDWDEIRDEVQRQLCAHKLEVIIFILKQEDPAASSEINELLRTAQHQLENLNQNETSVSKAASSDIPPPNDEENQDPPSVEWKDSNKDCLNCDLFKTFFQEEMDLTIWSELPPSSRFAAVSSLSTLVEKTHIKSNTVCVFDYSKDAVYAVLTDEEHESECSIMVTLVGSSEICVPCCALDC